MGAEDYLPTVLVVLGIFLLIRWVGGKDTPAATRDGIPGVTPATVEAIHAAFPDVPVRNIIYSLSRTRSGQATSEEIIERGFLPAAPATYTPPAALLPASVNPPSAPPSPVSVRSTSTSGPGARAGAAGAKAGVPVSVSLMERYGLGAGAGAGQGAGTGTEGAGAGAGAGSGSAESSVPGTPGRPGTPGAGAGKWEESKEARERGLRERKARMVLEARRRMLEKQEKDAAAATMAGAGMGVGGT